MSSPRHSVPEQQKALLMLFTLQPEVPNDIDRPCVDWFQPAPYSLRKVEHLGTNVDAALAALRAGQMDSNGTILNIGVPSSTIQSASCNFWRICAAKDSISANVIPAVEIGSPTLISSERGLM